jgi:hypothetical protein
VAAVDVEDHLAWEAKQRKTAAFAAALAAIFTAGGMAWRAIALSGGPSPGLLETLGRLEDPGPPIGTQRSLALPFFEHYQDQAASVIGSVILVGLGSVALGWALTYLAFATRARRPEFPKILLYLPVVAGVLNGIYVIASEVARLLDYDDVLSGPGTVDAVLDLGVNGVAIFAAIVGLPGTLGLALSLVFVALNAMRVGLLTRFMGVLGMITGALMVIQLPALLIVQFFWLMWLAFLFWGRWPGGVPPAWKTGKAEPWPTSAELREERQRQAALRRGETWDAPEPAAAGAGSGPSPATSARKRKKKRR